MRLRTETFYYFLQYGIVLLLDTATKSKPFHISKQFLKSDSMTHMHGNLPLTPSCMRPCVHCIANLHTVYGQLSQRHWVKSSQSLLCKHIVTLPSVWLGDAFKIWVLYQRVMDEFFHRKYPKQFLLKLRERNWEGPVVNIDLSNNYD